jgi:Putative serine esterase (DUF676)
MMHAKKHIVILVHGIRTFGDWQDRLYALLKSSEPAVEVHIYKYKYLGTLAFLLPPLRDRVVKEFREYLASHAEAWHDARVDIVAHSFGTYIVAQAIAGLTDEGPRFHTVILSGSVLQVTFPWNNIIRRGIVQRAINDCGRKDIWPLIAQMLVWRMGIAGRYGFVGVTGPDVGLVNRFFPFGHSGFFEATEGYKHADHFMERSWLPLLTTEDQPRGDSLVRPKARWFAGFEVVAEPLKLTLLALVCVGIYAGYGWASDAFDEANRRRIIAETRTLSETNPIEALVRLGDLGQEHQTDEAQAVKIEALRGIVDLVVYKMENYSQWSRAGWGLGGGGGYYQPGGLGDVRRDGLQLQGREHEFTVVKPPLFNRLRTVEAVCNTLEKPHLSTLRFSRNEDRILAAAQAFIFVYDTRGELIARTCEWHTKDQWNYLELLDGGSLLLASASEGQIMFFGVKTEGGEGQIHALTGEFDNTERSGGAIIALDMLRDGRVLSTHHLGKAFVWSLERAPRPGLTKLHEFEVPPSRGQKAGESMFKLSTDDVDFITSAAATQTQGPTYFLTTYKAGPATEWYEDNGDIHELRTLGHGDATVIYAGFSADGSRIVTLAEDCSLKIWDTAGGSVLVDRI